SPDPMRINQAEGRQCPRRLIPKIRASFCIFDLPLCLLDHAFAPRDGIGPGCVVAVYRNPWRAAIYVRVSTDKQIIENQVAALRQIAERRGWEIVEQYSEAGISGAKGRDGRPGLDQMLKDAQRRKFDVIMAWAIDRLGRSLIDLLGTIQTLEACAVDLYLDQQ